ncbi:MAG: mobile mystery protein B [Acidimicrobiia bacterium]
MDDAEPGGATPLADADLDGLKPTWVATRSDLDRVEQENIIKATRWVNDRSWTTERVLDEAALRRLHRRMYGDVWTWAGDYRRTQKQFGNLTGSDHWEIGVDVRNAVADTLVQVGALLHPDDSDHGTAADEVALRLHHRLVVVHPFASGNGRWSRQVATLLARALQRPDFTWSGIGLRVAGGVDRSGYVDALRAADDHDLGPLIRFARS